MEESVVEALFVENTTLIRHQRGTRREFRQFAKQTRPFSPFLFLSPRNYSPLPPRRALNTPRSSAERLYNRAHSRASLHFCAHILS